MSRPIFTGLGRGSRASYEAQRIEHVVVQRPLDRILAFSGRSIDEVVNSPLAKNHVYGYFRLHQWIMRESEVSEMERAWNPLGRRT